MTNTIVYGSNDYTRINPAMDELRAPVDKLEVLVERKVWPMPTYGDLLFEI